MKKHGNTTHGMTNTPEHKCWRDLINRCNNPKAKYYDRYGGRGIKVCKTWEKFENFYNDMGARPEGKYSIDRIDNNKGYFPENCRWATITQQNNNLSTNLQLTYKGETRALTKWAKLYNLNRRVLWSRLYVSKWTIEKSLITPVRSK